MKTYEYKVHFETVTPLHFGDAWQDNKAPFKTSSILGSLRFWFEVICYLSCITKPDDYPINVDDKYDKANKNNKDKTNIILKADLKQDEFRNKLKKLIETAEKNYSTEDLVSELLAEMKIPLPARIFGCTGWQGLIKVKKVKKVGSDKKINLPYRICISKSDRYTPILRNRACPPRSNSKYSVHYFPKGYFYGDFEVIFSTDENTAHHILFPLLKFIEHYGFIGGAWNSGFGRVKVNFKGTKGEYNSFTDYAEFANKPLCIHSLVKSVETKSDLLPGKKINKLRLFVSNNTQNFNGENIKSILEGLVKEKFYIRKNENSKEKFNQVFGTTRSPVHGSKILPWIHEVNEKGAKWKYGFISIVDILNLGKREDGKNES